MFVFLILCALSALYIFIRKRNNYWRKRGITSVKGNALLGTSAKFLTGRQSLENMHNDIYKAHPNEPYVGMMNFLNPILFIRDPEIIHQIQVKDFTHFRDRSKISTAGGRLVHHLFTLEGDEWRAVRMKLLPTFGSNKLKQMYGLIEECVDDLIKQHLSPSAKVKEPVDVKELTGRFTLDVIGCCAFGLQFNAVRDPNSPYRKIATYFSSDDFINKFRIVLQFFNPKLLRYFNLKAAAQEVETFFFDLLHSAEALRKTESKHRSDFLQLMLDIKEQEENRNEHLFTENHIVSNMFAFFVAGHETISFTISFCLHELATNPQVQEKLRSEIKKAREANNGIIDYNTLKSITYLDMVVSETLRLHAAAPINRRVCTETFKLPGSDIKLQPGDRVLYSVSAIHKDERYFPDPEKFDPERFSEENVRKMNPLAFQPFGSGPRICIGLRFAKLEVKLCLMALLSRFRFSCCDKTEIPVTLKTAGFFHAPKNPIWLTVEEIQD